ncbi:MAG: DHH family phosphoesterase, partial [Eggerthellaceae bacterium]|nr:DHH family phosphoesterase [Eggerthellaceae bacterium]
MCAQFKVRTADASAVAQITQQLDIPAFMARVMVSRGIDSPEKARVFLHPNLERDWRNPYEIPGLAEVVDRLEIAVRNCKHILVFGDFDLDGISATTVMARGLQSLGARVTPFIPMRFDEGYGLSEASIERAKTYKPDVIVTVDCGIASKNEAVLLEKDGIELLITDHHEPADLVPENIPVADPKLDPSCESSVLAGVGVALKVIQALGARMG